MVREILAFLRWHWVHLALAPILAVTGVTFLHEGAHALAVLAQGGKVTAFVWWPSGTRLGYIQYHFPPGIDYSASLISLAPYLWWSALAAAAAAIAWRARRLSRAAATTVFVWMYAVPLADVGLHVLQYVESGRGDLGRVFGAAGALGAAAACAWAALALGGGFHVQRGLYGERALRAPAYATLTTLVAAAVLGVAILTGG